MMRYDIGRYMLVQIDHCVLVVSSDDLVYYLTYKWLLRSSAFVYYLTYKWLLRPSAFFYRTTIIHNGNFCATKNKYVIKNFAIRTQRSFSTTLITQLYMRAGILLVCRKQLNERIILLRGEVWGP